MSEIDMTSTGQSHTVRLLNISNIKYQIHVHPLPDATRFFIEKKLCFILHIYRETVCTLWSRDPPTYTKDRRE